jgi:hypothetical protein
MFCPSCRTEYREGFTECSDCGVALVAELPPEELDRLVEGLMPVFVTTDAEELGRIVERLEKAEVGYVIEAGTALALLDGRDDELPHEWTARLSVTDDMIDRARRIVEQERRQPGGAMRYPEVE